MARTLRRLAALSLLAAALAPARGAGAAREPLPRLVGDAKRIECTDALALARASFFGKTFGLDMPSATPPGALHSHFVLEDAEFNEFEPETQPPAKPIFERIAMPANSSRQALWERGAGVPWRWVVTRDTRGWRGDQFGLYAVSASTSQEGFLAHIADRDDAKPASEDGVATVFEGFQWPYVLQSDVESTLWAMDLGETWRTFSRWKILVHADRIPASPCSISFGLEEGQSPLPLLPSELARLDALLIDALGPGTGEGSLHPTLRIQGDVQHTWGNIALRPWSLPQPYNTREEVEVGLAEWATQDADQRAKLARIHALVPRSERALAAYYRRVFGLTAQQARNSATHAIDVAVRMHFAFHSDRAQASGGSPAEPNPWPIGMTRRRDASLGSH